LPLSAAADEAADVPVAGPAEPVGWTDRVGWADPGAEAAPGPVDDASIGANRRSLD
jgi:hypothetical protein